MHELELQALQAAAQHSPDSTIRAATRLLELSTPTTRAIFAARALNAVADLAATLDEEDLGTAAGSASDYGVLMRVLEQPEAMQVLSLHEPLAPALWRGAQARDQLLRAEGGVLSAERVAQHLNISRQAVEKRRRAGRLLALRTGKRGYAYPAWQLAQDGVLSGLEDILGEIGSVDPWVQASFFLGTNSFTNEHTPLAALRSGDVEGARRAAQSFGEHGAP